jgi:hypothetical protein
VTRGLAAAGRLKEEREARLVDRHGARQRIQERDMENRRLREELTGHGH